MAVFGDLGRVPITIKSLSLGIKYWQNVASGTTPNKLLSYAYKSDMQRLHTSPWLQNIQSILLENGLGEFWNNPNIHNIYQITRTRLQDQFIQRWFESIENSISLHTLGILKEVYAPSKYLSSVKSVNVRRIITKLRLNFGLLNYSRLNGVNDRTCTLCDMNVNEDITHFLCVCPKYADERHFFKQKLAGTIPLFNSSSHELQVKTLLNLDLSAFRLAGNISPDEVTKDIISFLKTIVNSRNAS